jgi:hypothetical protein
MGLGGKNQPLAPLFPFTLTSPLSPSMPSEELGALSYQLSVVS